MKKYVDMTKKQIDEMDKNDVVLVSVVSPIEAHGSHLPVNTDVAIASEVMRRTTDALPDIKFIELPVLHIGAQPLPVTGSIGVRYGVLKNILIDYGKGLYKTGFRKWVVFDNHGGPAHMLAEADASRILKRRGFELMVPFIDIMHGMNTHDPDIGLPADRDGSTMDSHAGTNETSLYMAFNEGFNDNKYGKFTPEKSFTGSLIRLLGADSIGAALDWLNEKEHPSYVGDPSKADADSGNKMIDYHVRKYIDAIKGNYEHETGFNWFVKFLLRVIG
jgi:creatinine amidohydrolase/Fe(II)-dependent formamide hydrolase-like protein